MTKHNFFHKYSPDSLITLAKELSEVLSADELDHARLLALVEFREGLINTHLATLDGERKRQFVELEIKANEHIKAVTRLHFSDSLSQLSGLVRGLKAVEKYKTL